MGNDRLETIKGFYKKWLNREADVAGSTHYLESALSLEQIEHVIKNSQERLSIEKREKSGGIEFDSVEPRLLIGSAFNSKHFEKLVTEGITHVLVISPTDLDYSECFEKSLCLGLPETVVISVADLEKSIKFIQEFMTETSNGKLLVSGPTGLSRAPGIVAMWYIANGMDIDAATALVESCRDGCDINGALLGPWHFEAAQKLFSAV